MRNWIEFIYDDTDDLYTVNEKIVLVRNNADKEWQRAIYEAYYNDKFYARLEGTSEVRPFDRIRWLYNTNIFKES